ncbi:MAG: hypothetical protein Q4D02_04955 [Clostridia bacterium]|nr:hypothetical protein [Clostridia bacterium]
MDNKKITEANDIAKKIMWNFILWGILFSVVKFGIDIVLNSLSNINSSFGILTSIVSIFISAVITLLNWNFAISSSFKNRTTYIKEIPQIMKYLFIFLIVIMIINAISTFLSVKEDIRKEIEKNLGDTKSMDMLIERYGSYLDADMVSEYNMKKQEIVSSVSKKAYITFAISELVIIVVNLGILKYEESNILKYTID